MRAESLVSGPLAFGHIFGRIPFGSLFHQNFTFGTVFLSANLLDDKLGLLLEKSFWCHFLLLGGAPDFGPERSRRPVSHQLLYILRQLFLRLLRCFLDGLFGRRLRSRLRLRSSLSVINEDNGLILIQTQNKTNHDFDHKFSAQRGCMANECQSDPKFDSGLF